MGLQRTSQHDESDELFAAGAGALAVSLDEVAALRSRIELLDVRPKSQLDVRPKQVQDPRVLGGLLHFHRKVGVDFRSLAWTHAA